MYKNLSSSVRNEIPFIPVHDQLQRAGSARRSLGGRSCRTGEWRNNNDLLLSPFAQFTDLPPPTLLLDCCSHHDLPCVVAVQGVLAGEPQQDDGDDRQGDGEESADAALLLHERAHDAARSPGRGQPRFVPRADVAQFVLKPRRNNP